MFFTALQTFFHNNYATPPFLHILLTLGAHLMSPCASRRYLPVLRGFPAKYIYDPWNAPESVQAAAKCVIGVHYPKPMVHHAEASRLNIERMKQIYQQLSRYRGLGKTTETPDVYLHFRNSPY